MSDFQTQRVKGQEFECRLQKKPDSFTLMEPRTETSMVQEFFVVASDDAHIPLTLELCFEVTNNEKEFDPCIVRFQATIELKTEADDSSLVISRSNGKWKVKDQNPFNLDQVK